MLREEAIDEAEGDLDGGAGEAAVVCDLVAPRHHLLPAGGVDGRSSLLVLVPGRSWSGLEIVRGMIGLGLLPAHGGTVLGDAVEGRGGGLAVGLPTDAEAARAEEVRAA